MNETAWTLFLLYIFPLALCQIIRIELSDITRYSIGWVDDEPKLDESQKRSLREFFGLIQHPAFSIAIFMPMLNLLFLGTLAFMWYKCRRKK